MKPIIGLADPLSPTQQEIEELVASEMEKAKEGLTKELSEFMDWCFEVKKCLPHASLYEEYKATHQ